jgi:G protein beta subunit-like protein
MIQESDVTKIQPAAKFLAHKDHLTRVLLSPDVKHLATCSADHTAKIWNLDPDYPPAKAAAAEMSKAKAVTNANGNSNGVDHSDDTPASPSTPSELETPTNAASTKAPRQGGSASDLIASDFSLVASSSTIAGSAPSAPFPVQPDGPPIDPTTGNLYLESTLANHQRWVWDCAFSADSAYLVTVSSDHYARLWELATGQIIRQYSGHHRGAICVALNDYSEPR